MLITIYLKVNYIKNQEKTTGCDSDSKYNTKIISYKKVLQNRNIE